jgi:hypothetical protein
MSIRYTLGLTESLGGARSEPTVGAVGSAILGGRSFLDGVDDVLYVGVHQNRPVDTLEENRAAAFGPRLDASDFGDGETTSRNPPVVGSTVSPSISRSLFPHSRFQLSCGAGAGAGSDAVSGAVRFRSANVSRFVPPRTLDAEASCPAAAHPVKPPCISTPPSRCRRLPVRSVRVPTPIARARRLEPGGSRQAELDDQGVQNPLQNAGNRRQARVPHLA